MATSFFRTVRSLERDNSRRRWPVLTLAATLFAGWAAWFTQARVAVYASTPDGRLETSELVHPVAAVDTGRISELHVTLGRDVRKSDILVVLDSTFERRKLDEATVRLSALGPRIAALNEQLEAETKVRMWQSKSGMVNLDRAYLEQRRTETRATSQERLLTIKKRLHAENLATAIDTLNADSEAAERRLAAESARADVDRLRDLQRYDDERAHSRIAELQRELAELEGEQSTTRAAIETMRATIELRTVRAPVSGTLGNIAALQVGAVVRAGDVVATVVPSQDVHVVAKFAPAQAVGRILPGQRGRVRLSGFAWTQYGLVHATVRHVANEPHDGTIRVELALEPDWAKEIPVQHGLPGAVEVEVERLAPWKLLLRSVGYSVAQGTPPPVPSALQPMALDGDVRP